MTHTAPVRPEGVDPARPAIRLDAAAIHVAVLDDHVVVRYGVEILVRQSPALRWSGSAATSGELFQLLSGGPCHVLVLDYELSPTEIDGWSLVKILRARFPHVRILVYTSHVEASAELLMRQAGAHGFVSKSGGLSELLHVIELVGAGELYFSAALSAMSTPAPGFAQLTPRETEVLRCCLQGMNMTDIARKFVRSVKTVSSQKRTAYRKLGIDSDYELLKLYAAPGTKRP
ncbi:MAG: response regulator transcription factor [Burkholderiales bacterium]|nr:MAG: response regulator transcription factor [Burkholderiales bacterium]